MNPKVSPQDAEKYYAMQTFKLTSEEYDALLAKDVRFLSHGLFNRNAWHRKVKVHGGYAWSPCTQEYVDTLLLTIRNEAK